MIAPIRGSQRIGRCHIYDSGMTLTYEVSGKPDGVEFDSVTRRLTGRPTQISEDGKTKITVGDDNHELPYEGKVVVTAKFTASNGSALSGSYEVPYIVSENSVPSMHMTGNKVFQVGKPIARFMPRATSGDPPFEWSASGLPAGVSIDSETGVISGTPEATGDGDATVTLTDDDGEDATATLSWRTIA